MQLLNPSYFDSETNITKKNNKNKTYKKNVTFEDDSKKKINNLNNFNISNSNLYNNDDEDEDNNYDIKDKLKTSEDIMINSNIDVINNELNNMNKFSDTNNNSDRNKNLLNKYSYFNESYNNHNKNYDNNINEFFTTKDNNINNNLHNNDKLLKQLEYIIHLLEEEQNSKTNHLTEELILYLFLGIFIIFVLDSFARASKYVR